jgi:hypothetical protein
VRPHPLHLVKASMHQDFVYRGTNSRIFSSNICYVDPHKQMPTFFLSTLVQFLQFSPSTTPPGSSGINASVSLRGLTGSPFGASEQRIWVAVCVAFPTSIYPFSQSLHPVVSLNSLTRFFFFSFHLARSPCSELALHSSVLVPQRSSPTVVSPLGLTICLTDWLAQLLTSRLTS